MVVKQYSSLSTRSKSRYTSVLNRLEKSGITRKEVLELYNQGDVKTIKQKLGFQGKTASFEGLIRNIRGMGIDTARKQSVLNNTLPKFAKQGYRGKGLNLVKVRLNKTIGLNTFFDIARKVQSEHSISYSRSLSYTRNILQQAKLNFNRLTKKDKQILSYFS